MKEVNLNENSNRYGLTACLSPKEYIGIDKSIEIIMIENYLSGTIWKYFMENIYVKKD